MRTGIKSKHHLMAAAMGVLGLLLAARLFTLTVLQEDKWSSYAEDMTKRAVYETAPRGDVTDRNGRILATGRVVYSVNLSRVALDREKALESAFRVMELLTEHGESASVTQNEVRETLQSKGYDSYMPLTLAEDISADTAGAIEAAAYPGVQISQNYVRHYPEGALAAHIIGYMGRISEGEEAEYVEEKGYRNDALIGKSGIEKIYEDTLKGQDAVSTLQVDSGGNVTKVLERTEPVKGQDITLTIDMDLQKAAEDALEQAIEQAASGGVFQSEYGDYGMIYAKNAASGAAVALDVDTGETLAMASFPDFDPNDFAEGISAEKWASLQSENENDPLSPSPMYNVATMSAIQPGSTFKPITALAALSCGLDREQHLYDNGAVRLGGISYGCFLWNDSRATHGYVDLNAAMKASCNYYFYDVATGMDLASDVSLHYHEEITNETITGFAAKMGLGDETGIEIEESAGTLPSESLKKQGLKASLTNYLLAEQETYFKKSLLEDREKTRKYIEKIVNWADKDLTFEEIIGKLKKKNFVKRDKIDQLANLCKYTYFDQMEWTQGDTFNIAIGQGDNAYTTLQMANYMAVLGNGGKKNPVTLIADGNDNDGKDEGKASASRGENDAGSGEISAGDMTYVLEAMTGVASDPDGSLYGVFASFPYSVACKTGTAQRAGKICDMDEAEYLRRYLHLIAPQISYSEVEAEAGRLADAYPDLYATENDALRRAVINLSGNTITAEDIDKYKERYDNFAWTVALAPADDPQIAVAVMLVQGAAASNAAPVVREIIGKYGEISKWDRLF